MDTKERKRRRPAQSPEEAAARRQKAAQTRGNRGVPQQSRSQTTRRRSSNTGTIDRSRMASAQTRPPRQRAVREPDRENIPEVTYSMPKPFSRGLFLLKLVTVVAVVLAVMSCLSLFFQVDEILVSGADQYTPYAIKMASGIEEGDALLRISEPRTAGKIIDALPYVKSVKIGRNLPGTVNIQVEELEVTYAIQSIDESWWLIASDGRVVEQIDTTEASSYTKIVGVLAEAPRTNQQIQAADLLQADAEETVEEETAAENAEASDQELTPPEQTQETDQERMNTVLAILDQLERNEVIGQMSVIDVSSLTNITMEYGDRYHVVVGTTEDLGYKIAAMTSAVEQLKEYEIGELDVSFKVSDKVIFNPASA